MTTDKKQQKSPETSDGISFGLKLWLFFLVSFLLLGYSAHISILFSAIGALSAGFVVSWWKNKEEPRNQKEIDDIKHENPADLAGASITKKRMRGKQSRRKVRSRAAPDWVTTFWLKKK